MNGEMLINANMNGEILTINPSKCNLLVIPPKLNQIIFDFSIQLHNFSVVASNCVEYLRVYIDNKLTF